MLSALNTCKRWDCPTCRKYKAKLIQRKIDGALPPEGLYMLTLTLFRRGTDVEQWRHLNASWNRLLTYMRRHFGEIRYVAIREPHKKGGTPHLHVILDKYVWTRDTQRHAVTCGFGFQRDFRRLNGEAAKYYVLKYLTKEVPNEDFERARQASLSRVVSVSRNCGGIYPKSAGGTIIARYVDRGTAVFIVNGHYHRAIIEGYSDAQFVEHFFGASLTFCGPPLQPDRVETRHSIGIDERTGRKKLFQTTVFKMLMEL